MRSGAPAIGPEIRTKQNELLSQTARPCRVLLRGSHWGPKAKFDPVILAACFHPSNEVFRANLC